MKGKMEKEARKMRVKWGVGKTTGFEPGQQTWHKQNTRTHCQNNSQ